MSIRQNITIEQGATFKLPVLWKDTNGVPFDLAGFSARMQVRSTHASTGTLLNLTSAAGGIVLGGAEFNIVATASATATAALPAPHLAVYDLELVSAGGEVYRLLEGMARITPEVTR